MTPYSVIARLNASVRCLTRRSTDETWHAHCFVVGYANRSNVVLQVNRAHVERVLLQYGHVSAGVVGDREDVESVLQDVRAALARRHLASSCQGGRHGLARFEVRVGDSMEEAGPKCDLAELMRLPHGTFGREYADFLFDNSLEAGFDVCSSGPATGAARGRRLLDVHDFWHVLSGYSCDLEGELGLLAFTLGQGHVCGVWRVFARAVQRFRENQRKSAVPRAPLFRYLLRAYWRGRSARHLALLPIEHYFTLPIDAVRQRLRIAPSNRALHGGALPPVAQRPPREP